MTVWGHRAAGTLVGVSNNVALVSVPAGRTAIINRVDVDLDVVGTGVIRMSLVTASGTSLRRWEVNAGFVAGPQSVPSLERTLLHPGDILRMTVGAGHTLDYWVSYLLLQGEPS